MVDIENTKEISHNFARSVLISMYHELKEDKRSVKSFTLALVAFFMGLEATLSKVLQPMKGKLSFYLDIFFLISALISDLLGVRYLSRKRRPISDLVDKIIEDPPMRREKSLKDSLKEKDSYELSLILMGVFATMLTIILMFQ